MTHAERRQRRHEAGLKSAATRRAKEAATAAPATDPSPPVPSGGEILRRAAEAGTEQLLWQTVQWLRYPSRPSAWTEGQRRTLWGTIAPDRA